MIEKIIVRGAAESEPVSLNEARRQLKLDPGDDDDYLDIIIPKSRDAVEKYCNRYFSVQTVSLVIVPGDGLIVDLSIPDLTSIVSFKYYDEDFNETTVDPSGYTFISDLSKVKLAENINAYRYLAEVTTSAPAEYSGAKTAMLLMLNDLYELRGSKIAGVSVQDNKAAEAFAWPYRVDISV